jgi:hypothetical protein
MSVIADMVDVQLGMYRKARIFFCSILAKMVNSIDESMVMANKMPKIV